MPEMTGLACARIIREMERTGQIVARIPIVSVSANARSEQVIEAKDSGMDDHISKPFRIPELLRKIERWAWRSY
jgi:CheY-like chemotaxis protein